MVSLVTGCCRFAQSYRIEVDVLTQMTSHAFAETGYWIEPRLRPITLNPFSLLNLLIPLLSLSITLLARARLNLPTGPLFRVPACGR